MDPTEGGGRKDSQGLKKLPLHLLPYDAITAIANVLWYGARKYTTTFQSKWEGFWYHVKPVATTLITPKGSVVIVMRSDSGRATLIMRNDNDPTRETGVKETRAVNVPWPDIDILIQGFEKGISEPSTSDGYENLALMNKLSKSTSLSDARSAAVANTYTLTTTILRDGIVEFYAASTTTASGSLETTFRGLKEHLSISVTDNLLEASGQRNWEKGMAWSDVYGGVMRHLFSWWNKEGPDPETNFSHLWHAGCGLLFLITYEIRGLGKDDRP